LPSTRRNTTRTRPTNAEIQKLYDDSEDGIGAEDIRAFEGKDKDDDETPGEGKQTQHPVDISMSATERDKDAMALGRKMGEDAELMAEIGDRIDTDERRKRHAAAISASGQELLRGGEG
jgi:hypothetical protein